MHSKLIGCFFCYKVTQKQTFVGLVEIAIFEKSKHFINVMRMRQRRVRTHEKIAKVTQKRQNVSIVKHTPAYSGIIIKIMFHPRGFVGCSYYRKRVSLKAKHKSRTNGSNGESHPPRRGNDQTSAEYHSTSRRCKQKQNFGRKTLCRRTRLGCGVRMAYR